MVPRLAERAGGVPCRRFWPSPCWTCRPSPLPDVLEELLRLRAPPRPGGGLHVPGALRRLVLMLLCCGVVVVLFSNLFLVPLLVTTKNNIGMLFPEFVGPLLRAARLRYGDDLVSSETSLSMLGDKCCACIQLVFDLCGGDILLTD